jgi:predicted DCC family thiol-disulfide oxidoreductase YuxK
VFYDGGCELCASTREWAEARDAAGRLQFVNFRDAAVGPLPVPRARLEREMWVRRADGSLVAGAAAAAAVLACLPRWRWLAMVMRIPGVRAVAAVVYRLVARHRR